MAVRSHFPSFAESLEQRMLLSSVVVTSAADSSDYPSGVTIDQLTGPVTLRDAIYAANNTGGNNTITFSPSLAGSTIEIGSSDDGTFGPSAFTILSQITIDGSMAPGLILARNIAATPFGLRFFYVTRAGNLTLSNLTVDDGLAQGGNSGYGGGAAGLGGAIVDAGTLLLESDTFTGNQAIGGSNDSNSGYAGGGLGGSAQSETGGPPGGGAYNYNVGGNGGFGGGGGFSVYAGGAGGFGGGGSASDEAAGAGGFGGGSGDGVEDAAPGFAAGTHGGGGAGLGGAVFSYAGNLAIINSTFSDNSASGGSSLSGTAGSGLGGAVFNLNGPLFLADSTLAFNSANDGGALYSLGDGGIATQSGPVLPSDIASVTIDNSILAHSSSGYDFDQSVNDSSGTGNDTGEISAAGSNDIFGSTPVSLFSNSMTGVDPLLAGNSLGNYGGPTQTFALLPGSPALDSGDNSLAAFDEIPLSVDQRGDNRIVNSTVDIGAYESQGFTVTVAAGDNQSAEVGNAFSDPLSVSVTANDSGPTDFTGGIVDFTAPDSGAGATFSNNPATLSSSGEATVAATANSSTGSYPVFASADSADPQAEFWLTNDGAPVITTNPQSITVQADERITLTAAASATPAPTVQWQVSYDDGISFTNLPDQTDPTLAFFPDGSQNGDEYRAVFTNSFGTATTTTATLGVTLLTPAVTISDPGGVYNGSAHVAIAAVAGIDAIPADTLEGVAPILTYYAGSTAIGVGSTAPPINAGTYTVLAVFPGSADYALSTNTATFRITPATLAITARDLSTPFDNAPHSAAKPTTNAPPADADALSPLIHLSYQNAATGKVSNSAPIEPGTYAILASFDGNNNYSALTRFDTGAKVVISPFAQLAEPSIVQHSTHVALSGKIADLIPARGSKVTIKLAGTSKNAKLTKAGAFSASFSTAKLSVGTYSIQYSYSGPGALGTSTWNQTLTVLPKSAKSHPRKPQH